MSEQPTDTAVSEPVKDASKDIRTRAGSLRVNFVKRVTQAIAGSNVDVLRGLVEGLHEADLGDLIEALDHDLRPRLVELLGIHFDFNALTEVDDAVRGEILEELPAQTVADGVRELDSDDAVAILEDLPKAEQTEILDQLPPTERIAAGSQPRLSGAIRRPADADRRYRGYAVMERRAGHRLYA